MKALMKALIVDDDRSIRMLMGLIFQEILGDNYEILLAENGEEAMEVAVNENNVVLIVSDLNMPKKNGIELAKFIREYYGKIKIIIISNGATQCIQDAAKKTADMFLDKTEFLNNTSEEKQKEIIFSLL